MKKVKITITSLMVLSFVAVTGCSIFAMTVQSVERVQMTQSVVDYEPVEPVYLLNWQNARLNTTEGDFFLTNDIKVLNKTGLEMDEIPLQENPPIVQFVKESGKIIQVTILPNLK